MTSIESAKADLIRTTDRMLSLLSETPDDKLAWKPTPSSRSIMEIVAHSAHSLENIAQQLRGIPFAPPTSKDANEGFLEHDAQFSTREEVEVYFTEKRDSYAALLDTFTRADLIKQLKLPFGLGDAPLAYFMTMGHVHTMGHNAQIEYIQTMYGDHDWHLGF